METITSTAVASRITELVDRVSRGETFEIIQDDRPIARLGPPESESFEGRTLKDLILNGPSLEGVIPSRDRSPIRDVEL